MNNKKTVIRFFTIADYEDEEIWLHNQHMNGWKLVKMIPPCFYIFEKCTPSEVAYRLDYKNNSETSNYFQIFRDYGWEYIGRCVGWLYFRKPSTEMDSERDGEIFSDNENIMKHTLTFLVIGYLMCKYNNAKKKCFHLWGVVCTGQYLKHNSLFVLQCGRCISVRIIFLKRYFGGA